MIRLSKETDYGIVLLTHLAADPQRVSYSARELAQETHLPLPMVSKILKLLTRRDLLRSQRGVKGGYRLARRPEMISVAKIISAMEGPIALTECVSASGDCRHELLCPVRGNWKTISHAVRQALEGITLTDMARTFEPDWLPFQDKSIQIVSLQ